MGEGLLFLFGCCYYEGESTGPATVASRIKGRAKEKTSVISVGDIGVFQKGVTTRFNPFFWRSKKISFQY